MRYQQEHKPKSRERILQAARSVFAEVGFERATIEKIMSEAGMTRGGFYKHFPNKTALLLEIVSGGQVSVPDAVPCEVKDILQRYLADTHLDDKENACPLFAFPSEISRQSDDVKLAYENVAQSIASVLALALPDKNEKTALALMAMSVGCMVVMNSCINQEFKNTLRKATLEHIAKTTESENVV